MNASEVPGSRYTSNLNPAPSSARSRIFIGVCGSNIGGGFLGDFLVRIALQFRDRLYSTISTHPYTQDRENWSVGIGSVKRLRHL